MPRSFRLADREDGRREGLALGCSFIAPSQRTGRSFRSTSVESAQQLYDHVASTPGRPPAINRTTVLRGRAGRPVVPGCSRTIHYGISEAARIDYPYADEFRGGRDGDPHPVVLVLTIRLGSH